MPNRRVGQRGGQCGRQGNACRWPILGDRSGGDVDVNIVLGEELRVRAGSIALEGVRQEDQVGSRTVLDVLDAEQELLNARVSLVRAQRDEVVASFDVRRRIGTLLAAQLNLGVPTYDFAAYYKKVRNKWFGWSIDSK